MHVWAWPSVRHSERAGHACMGLAIHAVLGECWTKNIVEPSTHNGLECLALYRLMAQDKYRLDFPGGITWEVNEFLPLSYSWCLTSAWSPSAREQDCARHLAACSKCYRTFITVEKSVPQSVWYLFCDGGIFILMVFNKSDVYRDKVICSKSYRTWLFLLNMYGHNSFCYGTCTVIIPIVMEHARS